MNALPELSKYFTEFLPKNEEDIIIENEFN